MRTGFFVTTLVLMLCIVSDVCAKTWYVDGAVSASGDGTSPETAFKTIREGLNAASNGDTVIVAEGTYGENVAFQGKNIVLTSTDPADSGVVERTVIRRTGSVITFAGTEDGTCVLSGFTIRNGSAPFGGGICGGTEEVRTQANIRNNVITANSATANGGGIAYCDGVIEYNTISNNMAAGDGGGLYWCQGTIQYNTISNNNVTSGGGGIGNGGGGLAYCHGAIQHNTIAGNNGRWGGGLILCDGVIQNNVISRNTADEGGGLILCDAVIQNNIIIRNICRGPFGGGLESCNWIIRNNTIVGNSGSGGSGLFSCRGITLNCIIWGNTGSSQIQNPHETRYCCIEGWTAGGEGNIDLEPQFIDPANDDYRLSMMSPCIDVGENEDWMWHAVDLDSNRRILLGKSSAKVDMGAYEYDPEPPAGTTWYVDHSVSESGDGTSWATAKRTIQEGIDAASNDDTVLVAEGTYTENVRFTGKNIVLRSDDRFDGTAVSRTIIDGGGSGSVVTFSGTEDETCVLSGFTIRNGSADTGGGIYGGSLKRPTHARIENNIITANSVWGNGGGLIYCAGPILNNTIYGNQASQGGGLYECKGTVRNCIIWGNTAAISYPQISGQNQPTYSCIEGWTSGGEGNTAHYPYFVDAANGDFHLQSWSPCIDAGDRASPHSGEPEPNGERINIGAFGNTCEATPKSPDGDNDQLPDDWEMKLFGHLSLGPCDDPDRDLISNLKEYHRGTDPTGAQPVIPPANRYVDALASASGDGASLATAFRTIQEGINAARDGDTVIVAPGTYVENIHFGGKDIAVRSTDPLDPAVVTSTIIDADQSGSAVTLAGTEGETCVLSGFTIRNGTADYGGGICGGIREMRTRARIENNIITTNSANGFGGGLAFCDGIVQSNNIMDNSGGSCAGALFYSHGTIQNNAIMGNSAGDSGGLYHCDGTIRNNTIYENSATGHGGGLFRCDGAVQSNVIMGNSAGAGGGLSFCAGAIRNSTIVSNSADWGGGIAWCYGTFRNCIVWGNSAGTDPQEHGVREMTYTCIQGGAAGEGNITGDPQFVDDDGADDDPNTYEDNDYRLSEGSPCVDAGENEDWMSDAVDLDGNPRLWQGESSLNVDMGAYEYDAFPFRIREIGKGTGGEAELTWNSRPEDSYSIWSSPDPSNKKLWLKEGTIPSGGETTTWSDSDTTSVRKFYRIEVE